MPGIFRKVLILASANGLIIQGYGPSESHKAIHIDYKSRRIRDCSREETSRTRKDIHLESHGIIGLLSIATHSYLIAVTKREQVAQIFGKPIYVVLDVAFLPLSSQAEATKAIATANRTVKEDDSASDTELSESDAENTQPAETPGEVSSSPADEEPSFENRNKSSTSIAQDVITKKGFYGRFASQWFSKQGWGVVKSPSIPPSGPVSQDQESKQHDPGVRDLPKDEAIGKDFIATDVQVDDRTSNTATDPTSIATMLPRILRTTKLIFNARSYFFSYDFNLTKNMASSKGVVEFPTRDKLDPLYFWNRKLAMPFLEAAQDAFLLPVMQGFVGQRSFVMQKSDSKNPESACVLTAGDENKDDGVSHAIAHAKQGLNSSDDSTQPFLLTLISRRSVKRSGLRYLRRGIDDDGNCANAVETEQILSAPDWNPKRPIRSFVQIRGSIPLYFSQSPYAFKPVPVLHQSPAKNKIALQRHFYDLKNRYGQIQAVALVNKHGGEVIIGEAYENMVQQSIDSKELDFVSYEWFDFHAECRGMKFENVELLVQKLKDRFSSFGDTLILNGTVKTLQSGTFRVNCMDCLDRTNVAESAFGQYMLQTALSNEGFEIDLLHDEGTTWFNTLWADNGDAISRQYAGTAALKGDFTRTRKRNYRGALNDFSLTLSRYYNNMVNDYFSQAVIDVLLGNLSWKAFEDFETEMKSADPGISIDNVREAAIEMCQKVVIQDESEDLIHGWTMLAPAEDNTLRTLPFQEVVFLLTDAAVYCCKFDRTTEKVASFEKVDLRSIMKIRHGTYVTSTFSEKQTDQSLNAGIVISYTPGQQNMIRRNTRSLQNYVPSTSENQESHVDGGTGIMSWMALRPGSTSRIMALKVIPTAIGSEDMPQRKPQSSLDIAEHISDEIERALAGPFKFEKQEESQLVEKGDIISLADAKRRTGYLEQISHSIKKMVWT